jgi:aspartate ammonia-lyase
MALELSDPRLEAVAALGESFDLLTHALRVDRARVRALVAGSVIEATGLSPILGYEVTAELVKEAVAARLPIRDVVLRHRLLDRPTLARFLAPAALTAPRAHEAALARRVRASRAYRDLARRLTKGL